MNLQDPNYDPAKMLDEVKKIIGVTTDARLARITKIADPVISKVRHKRYPVSDSMLVKLHDATELPIRELRALMGIETPRPFHLECKSRNAA